MTYASFTINLGTSAAVYAAVPNSAATFDVLTGTALASIGTFTSVSIDTDRNQVYAYLANGTKYVFEAGANITVSVNEI